MKGIGWLLAGAAGLGVVALAASSKAGASAGASTTDETFDPKPGETWDTTSTIDPPWPLDSLDPNESLEAVKRRFNDDPNLQKIATVDSVSVGNGGSMFYMTLTYHTDTPPVHLGTIMMVPSVRNVHQVTLRSAKRVR